MDLASQLLYDLCGTLSDLDDTKLRLSPTRVKVCFDPISAWADTRRSL
jgi:hypothetical protein